MLRCGARALVTTSGSVATLCLEAQAAGRVSASQALACLRRVSRPSGTRQSSPQIMPGASAGTRGEANDTAHWHEATPSYAPEM